MTWVCDGHPLYVVGDSGSLKPKGFHGVVKYGYGGPVLEDVVKCHPYSLRCSAPAPFQVCWLPITGGGWHSNLGEFGAGDFWDDCVKCQGISFPGEPSVARWSAADCINHWRWTCSTSCMKCSGGQNIFYFFLFLQIIWPFGFKLSRL